MIYNRTFRGRRRRRPPLELYPALAFDRLFRDEVGKADRVLDAVLDDATDFRKNVSKATSAADEYSRSVRGEADRSGREGRQGQGFRPTLKARHARPVDGIHGTSTSTCG